MEQVELLVCGPSDIGVKRIERVLSELGPVYRIETDEVEDVFAGRPFPGVSVVVTVDEESFATAAEILEAYPAKPANTLLLSVGVGDTDDIAAVLNAGADDCITPSHFELVGPTKIRALLRRSVAEASAYAYRAAA